MPNEDTRPAPAGATLPRLGRESVKTFAIDFDGTWSADPDAFAAFAYLMRRRGHRVIIVTARNSGHAEVEREAGPFVDRVLFSGATLKAVHAVTKGEGVDIWIDDRPEMIGSDIDVEAHLREEPSNG